jgi:excisionase family DNA binding protein
MSDHAHALDDEKEAPARRLSSREVRALLGKRIQVLGVDAPPQRDPTDSSTGVVDFAARESAGQALAELVADAVVAKLRAGAEPVPPAPPIYISVDEAARLLGITRDAIDKRIQRRQVPGVVRTAGRRVQIHREKFLAGLERRAR